MLSFKFAPKYEFSSELFQKGIKDLAGPFALKVKHLQIGPVRALDAIDTQFYTFMGTVSNSYHLKLTLLSLNPVCSFVIIKAILELSKFSETRRYIFFKILSQVDNYIRFQNLR